MKTLKTNRIFAVLMLTSLVLSSFNLFAQHCGLQTEGDGFKWERICQGEKEGAKSVSGTTFIPLSREYTFICYHSSHGGWFSVKKNGGVGVCDITGRETVAPGRYDDANYYQNEEGYIYIDVRLNGKKGVCDENGKEIIAPRYESLVYYDGVFVYKNSSGKWVSTGVTLEKSSSSSYASGNSSSSSSSSSSFSTTTTTTVTPTPTPQPQPQPQPRPMQVWKPCPYCQGGGQCKTCLGTGHTLVYPCQDRCWNCGGTGKCTHCAGQGGQNVIEYH